MKFSRIAAALAATALFVSPAAAGTKAVYPWPNKPIFTAYRHKGHGHGRRIVRSHPARPTPVEIPHPNLDGPPKLDGAIDRSGFRDELTINPWLVWKMAWMVNGEVGRDAPLKAKIVQLETAFNRAHARGQTLQHVLLSVKENPSDGYYAIDTYCEKARPSGDEVVAFAENVLAPVLDGSNKSDIGYGPMTGNASGAVAAHQFRRGQPGYHLPGGDSYFREGPFINPFEIIAKALDDFARFIRG